MSDKPIRRKKLAELREQYIEALGFDPGLDLETEDGTVYHVPHPSLVDDDTQARLDAVYAGVGLDRAYVYHPVTGEIMKGPDEKPITRVVEPHVIDGKPAPSLNTRLAIAILGEKAHKEFTRKGGRSTDIVMAWDDMAREHKAREEQDPKS